MHKFGMFFGIVVILSIYGIVNYFIAKRTYQWLSLIFPYLNVKFYASIYIFLALSIVLAFLPLPFSLKKVMIWISGHWMGVFISLFLFIIAANLFILLAKFLKLVPAPLPQNIHFYTGLVVMLIVVSFVSYGLFNANQVKLVSYDLQTKTNVLETPKKIVLISDLHIGAANSEGRLEHIVTAVNKLQPDLVTIAGDIFNDDFKAIQDPERVQSLLKSITAVHGVYASLGNHDGGSTFNNMTKLLEDSDITLLSDEHEVINDEFILVGRVDPSPIGGFDGLERRSFSEVFAEIDRSDLPIIVMDHTPSKLNEYNNSVDLIVSGHTHKGQIFPGSLITNAIFEVDYGYYEKDKSSPHVVVTSGAGTWGMPMRVGTNNEIVTINLR